jgi:hypothetical protein
VSAGRLVARPEPRRRAGRFLAALTALSCALGLVLPARAEDEAVEKARAALIAAAAKGDGAPISAALDEAQKLVGPGAVWPDLGVFADWVETLPPEVNKLRTVMLRRGWAYLMAKRGQHALPLLEAVKAKTPKDGVVLAYTGEAKRLIGDSAGSLAALKEAVANGASDELVVPTLRKIAYESWRDEPKPAEGDDAKPPADLPHWVAVGETVLAVRDAADVRLSLVRWAMAGGDADRSPRAALLREKAVTLAWPVLVKPPADRLSLGISLARLAFDLARQRTSLPADAKGLPTRFDLLAQAVRLGDVPGADGHEVPEALAGLAEEALGKGRYVLADKMARRRLSISDSPAARRVLLALPPDVGD